MKRINVTRDIESRRRIAERRMPAAEQTTSQVEQDESRKEEKAQADAGSQLPEAPKPEEGRPKGTLKRFPFEQTRLGFMLRYEMPVVYFVLKKLCSAQSVFEPDWHVIESVARASKDASYRKPKFRRYLEEYSRNGLFCRRGKVLTPRRKTYYEGICRRKIEYFIQQNRKLLLKEARNSPKGERLLQNIRNMTKTIS